MTPDPDALHSALAEALRDLHLGGPGDADAILAYPAVVAALEGYSAALAGSEPVGLREAVEDMDGAWQWVADNYPAALTSMPTYLYRTLDRVRSALAPTPTASPTGEDSDD